MGKAMTTNNIVNEGKENINLDVESILNENNELKRKLEEQSESFSKELEAIKAMINNNSNKNENNKLDNEYEYIRPDKYIKVMSLTPELLNLNVGNGKVIQFKAFGDIKNIMYMDLANIISNNQTFAENGAFYIFSQEAINVLGLREYYNNILDKKGIEELLNKDFNEIKEILLSVSDIQKKAIVNIVVNQIVNGKDFGTLVINTINEVCNVDIMNMVNEMENYEKEIRELESINKNK